MKKPKLSIEKADTTLQNAFFRLQDDAKYNPIPPDRQSAEIRLHLF